MTLLYFIVKIKCTSQNDVIDLKRNVLVLKISELELLGGTLDTRPTVPDYGPQYVHATCATRLPAKVLVVIASILPTVLDAFITFFLLSKLKSFKILMVTPTQIPLEA